MSGNLRIFTGIRRGVINLHIGIRRDPALSLGPDRPFALGFTFTNGLLALGDPRNGLAVMC